MATKNHISIFVVILNWNGFRVTVSCIDSLKKSSVQIKKIIVFDQASEDNSGVELLKYYKNDHQILVFLNDQNYGFAVGMNRGIGKALEMGAEFIFLLNNDTIVDEYCVQNLHEIFLNESKVALSGPAIMYYSHPEKIWQGGGYFNKLKMGVTVPSKGRQYSNISHSNRKVTFLTGCALMVHASTFNKVGFFDSALFFYGDDVEFELRVREAGLNMYFVPKAKVWHKIEDINVARTNPFVLYNLARSSIIVLRKRFNWILRVYGIVLYFTVYTVVRIWQVVRGGSHFTSIIAWWKGLLSGLFVNLDS